MEARERIIAQLENWAKVAKRQVNLSKQAYDQEAARIYQACADWLRQLGDKQ